jgi:putative membrane protein
MIRKSLLAMPFAMLLTPFAALAQTQPESTSPTIPETQLAPAPLSSPFEFLSAATSVDDFFVKSGALAGTLAGSPEVKALAAELAALHAANMQELRSAGTEEKIEIARPSVDGEQKGMLSKLEALKGAEFDRSYVEAQLYAYQRAIALYRGYAEKADNLGRFAALKLPAIQRQYAAMVALADQFGMTNSVQTTPSE